MKKTKKAVPDGADELAAAIISSVKTEKRVELNDEFLAAREAKAAELRKQVEEIQKTRRGRRFVKKKGGRPNFAAKAALLIAAGEEARAAKKKADKAAKITESREVSGMYAKNKNLSILR